MKCESSLLSAGRTGLSSVWAACRGVLAAVCVWVCVDRDVWGSTFLTEAQVFASGFLSSGLAYTHTHLRQEGVCVCALRPVTSCRHRCVCSCVPSSFKDSCCLHCSCALAPWLHFTIIFSQIFFFMLEACKIYIYFYFKLPIKLCITYDWVLLCLS